MQAGRPARQGRSVARQSATRPRAASAAWISSSPSASKSWLTARRPASGITQRNTAAPPGSPSTQYRVTPSSCIRLRTADQVLDDGTVGAGSVSGRSAGVFNAAWETAGSFFSCDSFACGTTARAGADPGASFQPFSAAFTCAVAAPVRASRERGSGSGGGGGEVGGAVGGGTRSLGSAESAAGSETPRLFGSSDVVSESPCAVSVEGGWVAAGAGSAGGAGAF